MSYLTCSLPLTVGPDLPHVELNNNYTGVEGSLESKLISTKGEYDLGETPLTPSPSPLCPSVHGSHAIRSKECTCRSRVSLADR